MNPAQAAMPTETHLPFIGELFEEYAAITLPLHGALVADDKADGSAVTKADRDSSRHVLERLNRYRPEHGVISEEESVSYLLGAEWQWAIDPLDGTAAFARGLPVWGLGMGLLRGDEPVAGYLHFPGVRQSFSFENGTGRLNGGAMPALPDRVAPDTRNVMITAIHDYVDVRRVEGYRLHNLGSNLYHLIMLAAGRCDAIITGPCYLWDLAPALPFTRQLGHVERYLDGSAFRVADLLKPDHGFPRKQPMLVGPEEVVDRLIRQLA